MAVHRTRPRKRNSISGKRLRQAVLLSSMLIGFLGFVSPSFVHAQEGGLSSGAASYAAGKFDATVRQMTNVLQGDKVAPTDAAKALYFRGLAYQKLGQSTRAIADLGAAVWLGLSPSERTAALVNRSLAYRAAGLASQADAELASARKDDSSGQVDKLVASNGSAAAEPESSMGAFATQVRPEGGRTNAVASSAPTGLPEMASHHSEAANPSSWSTTSAGEPASEPSSGNRLSRWWGSVRGSSSEPTPAPAPAPSSPPKPPAVTTAWTTQTQADSTPETRVATASPTVPVPSAGGVAYRLQLSPTRSEAEAQALWQQVSKQNQQLAGLQPHVEKTDMGNLGTFYRLQIGPFPDKAESIKVCNALKRSGVDCFLVSP
jgi:tetratricopeptide (TPR) repeat protein